MVEYRAVSKILNNNEKVIGYNLENLETHSIIYADSYDIKMAMLGNSANILNLGISVDGKLISIEEGVIKEQKDRLVNTILKSKLLTGSPKYIKDGIAYYIHDNKVHCHGVDRLIEYANILEGTEVIEYKAFDKFSRLKKIKIPESVRVFEFFAFGDCAELKEINIPAGLRSIHDFTFKDCAKLKTVVLPYSVTHIGAGAFQGCKSLENLTLYTIEDSIPVYMFNSCEALKEIKLPSNVKYIHAEAFRNCKNLQKVEFSGKIKIIEHNAFLGCVSLSKESKQSILDNGYIGVF